MFPHLLGSIIAFSFQNYKLILWESRIFFPTPTHFIFQPKLFIPGPIFPNLLAKKLSEILPSPCSMYWNTTRYLYLQVHRSSGLKMNKTSLSKLIEVKSRLWCFKKKNYRILYFSRNYRQSQNWSIITKNNQTRRTNNCRMFKTWCNYRLDYISTT